MIDGGEAIRKFALNLARFSGLAPLAKPFVGGIGAILMLHRVTASPERPHGVNRHLTISPAFLDELITDMKASGYVFVSMDEAVARIRDGRSGQYFAALTADDAYRDNLTEALPVLEKHQAPMTIYVAPGLIDGATDLWWDVIEDIVDAGGVLSLPVGDGNAGIDCTSSDKRVEANCQLHAYLTRVVPENRVTEVVRALAKEKGVDPDAPRRRTLMNWDEIRTIDAHPLITIGAHSIHHHNLKRLSEEDARREIADVRTVLEERLGRVPDHFAYPYGYARAACVREVRLAREAGYVSAVTTRHGVLHPEHANFLHALPRISVNGRYQNVAHIRTMLSGVTTPLANAGKVVVTV
jgi:peptidoglycan/xylan/chitin deacetylase (PgdA/CDA1 family)